MRPLLLHIMVWGLFGAKPLSKPMMTHCRLDYKKQTSVKPESKYLNFPLQWRHNERDGIYNHRGSIVYSTVCSWVDQRKQRSASLAFVRGIHRWLVNSPHKGPVTRKMLPFDDVIMRQEKASEYVICNTSLFYSGLNLFTYYSQWYDKTKPREYISVKFNYTDPS